MNIKAKKAALENGLDVTKIKGTGNFNRVTEDDVLLAAGKKAPPLPTSTPVLAATPVPTSAAIASENVDGVVAMTAMQKVVARRIS